jgi:pimeloyl-ACP methyl ester carboxylesterase
MSTQWKIPGSDGEAIIGNVHLPASPAARGVMLLAHGFKGYKDYGMFPRLARTAAEAGFIAHRFNFSHSGMTDRIETFERPDLFERDTWNRQVHDLDAVIDAVTDGRLEGGGLPFVLFGHSRGGVTVLLTAGRRARDLHVPPPAGVIAASAPSRCNVLTPDEQAAMLERGGIDSPSARTGQALRVGRAFLQEQLDDPEGHDVPALVARITCPVLLAHGRDDPTVPAACAAELGAVLGPNGTVRVIDGGDHVFNTPNPMDDDADPSPQLRTLLDAMTEFAIEVTGG